MMKRTHSWCKTPPSITVRINTTTTQTLQLRRGIRVTRPKLTETQGVSGKGQKGRGREEASGKQPWGPTLVVQRQEMAAFFKLFDDDLIQDFLWMDCCFKISDKYLLAMTFVYFKRARFGISEHSRMNFFIALYLANTMEEDDEESKYEIFPWALGKSWRKNFPRFLKQRDKLWARIEYRAAVNRRCCEEVMAIVPSHFIWQRERAAHHSGAQRQNWDREAVHMPRGPSAPPEPCSLCARSSSEDLSLSSSPCLSSSNSSSSPNSPLPHAVGLSLETTPAKARGSRKPPPRGAKARRACICSDNPPWSDVNGETSHDHLMDWINEE